MILVRFNFKGQSWNAELEHERDFLHEVQMHTDTHSGYVFENGEIRTLVFNIKVGTYSVLNWEA